MKQLSEIVIYEYKYDSEVERIQHVQYMEAQGFECTGQVRKSDDLLTDKNQNWYWYAKFIKQLSEELE